MVGKKHGCRKFSFTFSIWAKWRTCHQETWAGILEIQNQKILTRRTRTHQLADVPYWCKISQNLADTELLARSHNSQSSVLERLTEVVTKTRKHSSYTHFPKDRNCDVCFRTLNGFNVIRAELKLLRRWVKEFANISRGFRKSKSHVHRHSLEFGKILSTFFMASSFNIHFIDPRRVVWLKEWWAQERKHLQYCSNMVWMRNGGLILWSGCEMWKSSWQMWNIFMRSDL